MSISKNSFFKTPFADTPYESRISNHPPHILNNDGTFSPSSFIPFCSFAGNMNITGIYSNKLGITVCNIFKETMVDGQLCYQADFDKLRDKVDNKKMVTEGFVFLLDYNEDRMVEEGNVNNVDFSSIEKKEAFLSVETIGEN